MLHRHITHNQFVVFSLYSMFLTFMLGLAVIEQIQTPTVYADEYKIHVQRTENTKKTNILLFGDMMLDRNIRKKINENGMDYPFKLIKDKISDNDIVVANAEGPFTFFNSVTLGVKDGPLKFTFDPRILPTLKNIGFTLLGQANNHTLNFGEEGLNQSTTSIMLSGLNYFGDPSNKNSISYIAEINNQKIGFVGYNEFSYQGKDNVISEIENIRNQVSYLIVYSHWGEEYNPSFITSQQDTAHEFIDAGADAVIGMHPHVIEPIEFYKNKPIFYSIGNFIFDQNQSEETKKGLAIKITVDDNSVVYEINPINIENGQASYMKDPDKQEILSSLEKSVINPNDFREDLTTGLIKINK